MKANLKLDTAAIKGAVLQHVEKVVLSVVAVLVLYFVYISSQQKPISADKSPDKLMTAAQEALRHVRDDETWGEDIEKTVFNGDPGLLAERFPVPDDYARRVKDALVDVDYEKYPLPVLLDKPLFRQQSKRTDPDLYPVENLEVAAGYGPLAIGTGGGGPGNPPPVDGTGEEIPSHIKVEGFQPKSASAAEGIYFVSLTGLVPVRRQEEEYAHRFANALAYSDARDVPKWGPKIGDYEYVYVVERAEVLPDGSLSPWQPVGNSAAASYAQQSKWAETAEEIVDEAFVDKRFTQPLMPVMLRDLTPFAMHSKVQSKHAAASPAKADPAGENGPKPPNLNIPPAIGVPAPAAAAAAQAAPAADTPTAEKKSSSAFKLFRYFDTTVVRGKSYQYRVRLLLEDPNDPLGEVEKPPLLAMDEAVVARLNDPKRAKYLQTEYSAPSSTVTIPGSEQILGGPVFQERFTQLPNGARIPLNEKTAKLMALIWDSERARDVPGIKEVSRGSMLNFTADVKVINPVKRRLELLSGYRFVTDALVVDLWGGVPSKPSRNDPPETPGEALLMDRYGNLIIRRELDDLSNFRNHDYGGTPGGGAPPPATGGGSILGSAGNNTGATGSSILD